MITTTDLGVLRLLTWLSPAFPTGAFAYSHGLEWAVDAGVIRDGETLTEWMAAVIAHGSGRNDTILVRHAYRAARRARVNWARRAARGGGTAKPRSFAVLRARGRGAARFGGLRPRDAFEGCRRAAQ